MENIFLCPYRSYAGFNVLGKENRAVFVAGETPQKSPKPKEKAELPKETTEAVKEADKKIQHAQDTLTYFSGQIKDQNLSRFVIANSPEQSRVFIANLPSKLKKSTDYDTLLLARYMDRASNPLLTRAERLRILDDAYDHVEGKNKLVESIRKAAENTRIDTITSVDTSTNENAIAYINKQLKKGPLFDANGFLARLNDIPETAENAAHERAAVLVEFQQAVEQALKTQPAAIKEEVPGEILSVPEAEQVEKGEGSKEKGIERTAEKPAEDPYKKAWTNKTEKKDIAVKDAVMAVLVRTKLNLRDERNGNVLTSVSPNTEVKILDPNGFDVNGKTFVKVETQDTGKKTGYVALEYLGSLPKPLVTPEKPPAVAEIQREKFDKSKIITIPEGQFNAKKTGTENVFLIPKDWQILVKEIVPGEVGQPATLVAELPSGGGKFEPDTKTVILEIKLTNTVMAGLYKEPVVMNALNKAGYYRKLAPVTLKQDLYVSKAFQEGTTTIPKDAEVTYLSSIRGDMQPLLYNSEIYMVPRQTLEDNGINRDFAVAMEQKDLNEGRKLLVKSGERYAKISVTGAQDGLKEADTNKVYKFPEFTPVAVVKVEKTPDGENKVTLRIPGNKELTFINPDITKPIDVVPQGMIAGLGEGLRKDILEALNNPIKPEQV